MTPQMKRLCHRYQVITYRQLLKAVRQELNEEAARRGALNTFTDLEAIRLLNHLLAEEARA